MLLGILWTGRGYIALILLIIVLDLILDNN
jgi:hypothetical protein